MLPPPVVTDGPFVLLAARSTKASSSDMNWKKLTRPPIVSLSFARALAPSCAAYRLGSFALEFSSSMKKPVFAKSVDRPRPGWAVKRKSTPSRLMSLSQSITSRPFFQRNGLGIRPTSTNRVLSRGSCPSCGNGVSSR